MNSIEKYEGITGEELPRKMPGKPMRYLDYDELRNLKMKKDEKGYSFWVPSWGSHQNNPCNVNYTEDGRKIEEYQACSGAMSMYYIEKENGEA